MASKDTTHISEQTLDRLLALVGAADQKTGLILAIDTGMLGVLAALAPSAQAWTIFSAIVASIAVLTLLTSVICLAMATFPRTRDPKGSLIYFGGIVTHTEADYVKKISSISNSEYLEDLARQCYRNAEIAQTKYTFVRTAMLSLFVSVVPWLIAVGLLYGAK
jgi:hypothetical protein